MAKVAKKKAKPSLLGDPPATTKAAVAIKELRKTKVKLAVLNRRRSFLIKLIKEEGCGSVPVYRTYMSHSPARQYWATKKASDTLKLIAISERS